MKSILFALFGVMLGLIAYLEMVVKGQDLQMDALRSANGTLGSAFHSASSCPTPPTIVDLRIGIMSSPKIRVPTNLNAMTRHAITRSARFRLDAFSRHALASGVCPWPAPWEFGDRDWHGPPTVAVDLTVWPSACRRLSVRRRPGDTPAVHWLPRECAAARPRARGLSPANSYGVIDRRSIEAVP